MLSRLIRSALPTRWWMAIAWERRARRNARHYIADFRAHWDNDEEFFASGRDDVNRFLQAAGWSATADKSLLEIGCGIGRMSRHLADRFASVHGIDISPSMIAQARRLHTEIPHLEFSVSSGVDLRGFEDASFDYVLSYIVFQHIPDQKVIYSYVREALRVLKPGGRFRFQARNDFVHARPDTYGGASIAIDEVRAIAREAGRSIRHVSGEGTGECYVEIG